MDRIGALALCLTFAAACAGDIYRIERPSEGDGEGVAGDDQGGDRDCGPGEATPDGDPDPGDPDGGVGQPNLGGGPSGGDPGVVPDGDPGFLPEPVDYERYVTEVNLLLTLSCAGCHAANGGAGGYSLSSDTNDQALRANYDGTVARSNTLAPAASLLLTKSLGVAHGGGPTWPSIEDCRYLITAAWIDGSPQPDGCDGFLP